MILLIMKPLNYPLNNKNNSEKSSKYKYNNQMRIKLILLPLLSNLAQLLITIITTIRPAIIMLCPTVEELLRKVILFRYPRFLVLLEKLKVSNCLFAFFLEQLLINFHRLL